MTCVFTGAQILIEEYGLTAPADLYLVGNAIIARWNIHRQQWADNQTRLDRVTHKITCNPSCWMREEFGVIVVPRNQCEGPLRLPPQGIMREAME